MAKPLAELSNHVPNVSTSILLPADIRARAVNIATGTGSPLTRILVTAIRNGLPAIEDSYRVGSHRPARRRRTRTPLVVS